MRISYEWLKDYIEINQSPEQLADDLSLFGHEVDSIDKVAGNTVLDFEITPNRGDCLSILGMAREIAALYNVELKLPPTKVKETKIDKSVNIIVTDPKICPRFSCRIIDNIKIGSSPDWLKDRLETYGFRSINNVVDITNYVMVATGQPMHAFDYDKIQDGKFNIRLSKKDEEVMTLDGVNRKLDKDIVIFEDDEKIFDLAGIMGGYKSEVDQNTKTIVLTAAIFDPVLVRKASKYLNHSTDASYRYERGVDYEGNIYGLDMAADLIDQLVDDVKISALTDVKSQSLAQTSVSYDPARINRLLGTKLTDEEIEANLSRLKFVVSSSQAKVPSYRLFDIKIWQDIAEEVARIHGYNNLGKNNLDEAPSGKNIEFIGTEKIKDELSQLGFTEIYSYSFADKNKLTALGLNPDNQPQIAKPLSSETEYLRPSLLPSLLGAIAKNPWAPNCDIFEMEAVFGKDSETWQLGLATVGKSDALIKQAAEKLGLDAPIESVDQKVLDELKIRRPVKYLIVDIDKIKLPKGDYSLEISKNKYQPISKYPPTIRDLAFIVDGAVKSAEMMTEIKKTDDSILLVELFDEFSSDKFGPGKKNVAFHLWLSDLQKPVAETDANQTIQKVIQVLKEKFSATLRS